MKDFASGLGFGGKVLRGVGALVVLIGLPMCNLVLGLDQFVDCPPSCDGVDAGSDAPPAACKEGETRSCYDFDAGAPDAGNCKAGTQTCKDGAWGSCEGQVGPQPEDCSKPGDEDCDGLACSDIVWSALYGDSGEATLNALAVDKQGNIFVGGVFKSTLTFGSMMLTAQNKTAGDGFVAKLKPDGTAAWAKSFGGSTASASVHLLAADDSGRVAVAGWAGNAFSDLGCGSLGVSGNYAFVAQYDKDGNCLWSRPYESDSSVNASGLAVDPMTGDVILAGSFTGNADFGAGPVQTLDPSDYDLFLVRLHSGASTMGGGSLVWASTYGGSTVGGRAITGIAVGSTGSIGVVGRLRGDLSTSFGSIMSSTSNDNDMMYAALDSSGMLVDVRTYAGGSDKDFTSIAIDPTGKPLLAGFITESVDFGNGKLTTTGPNDRGSVLLKLGSDLPIFSKMWGDSSYDAVTSVVTDKDSNIILAGATLGTINFGGADLSNVGQGAAYLVKLSPAAKHVWSKGFSDTSMTLRGDSLVAVDPTTREVVCGFTLTGSVDLGKGKLTATGQNIVLAKFNP
jgi:hypothetical protein